jgi:hypothetical protein
VNDISARPCQRATLDATSLLRGDLDPMRACSPPLFAVCGRWALVVCIALTAACSGDDDENNAGAAGASGSGSAGQAGQTGNAGNAGQAGNAGSSGRAGASGVEAGDAGDAGDAGALPDAGTAARPHPLYPELDLDDLPGDGGGAIGPYQAPMLPVTTRTVTVTGSGAQARNELYDACSVKGTAVTVPDGAGRLGVVDFGHVEDCDVTLGSEVIIDLAYLGHLPGPMVAPAHRLRIRGGQIGSIMVDPGSSDLVLDGVTLNNAVLPPSSRSGTGIYLISDGDSHVNRFAFVRSVLRMVATPPSGAGDSDGCAYLAGGAQNVLFAGNNIVTAGNRNSWGFRIGGGSNYLFVDNRVRVSFHKLIRMNDGPVDYVYVKGGTWMREATLTAGGDMLNDSFAQLGDLGTDRIFIDDPVVYLLPTTQVSFGAGNGPGQAGKSWQARRIEWHARSASVVSDAILGGYQAACAAGASCDYGLGTHRYHYDPDLRLPDQPWHELPGLAESDPDALPIAP